MRFVLKCLLVLTCLVLGACSGSHSGSGEESTATTTQALYPPVPPPHLTPWLVVLCQPFGTTGPAGAQAAYQKLFTKGQGGLSDYWSDQSYGNVDLTGSWVTDWVTSPYTVLRMKRRTAAQQVQDCINTQLNQPASALGGIAFGDFYNYIAVYNFTTFAAPALVQAEPGVQIGTKNVTAVIASLTATPTQLEHEMGHGYTLEHSFGDNVGPMGVTDMGEYADGYDVMGAGGNANFFAGNRCAFAIPPTSTNPCATGPGLDMWNRYQLGWTSANNVASTPAWPNGYAPYNQTFTLASRSHPELSTGSVPMVLLVRAHQDSMYTVEFVTGDKWDQGITTQPASSWDTMPSPSLHIDRVSNGSQRPYLLSEPGGSQNLNTFPYPFDDGVVRIGLNSTQGSLASVSVTYTSAFPQTKQQWWPNTFNGQCGGNFVADVNGDGYADLVGLACGSVGVVPSQGTSFGTTANYATWWPNTFNGQYGNFVADVTGDRKADLIGVGPGFVAVVPATPEGGFGVMATGFGTYETWLGGANGSVANFVADVTGDTKGDLVKLDSSSITVYPATPQGAGVRATSFGAGVTTSGTFFGSFGTFLGDVNGDGRADVVALNNGSVTVALSNGTGFNPPETWLNGTFCGAGSLGSFLADVTGDLRADIICTGQGTISMAVSTGQTFAPETWSTVTFTGNITTRVGDVNGDGLADLVAFDNSSVNALPSIHW